MELTEDCVAEPAAAVASPAPALAAPVSAKRSWSRLLPEPGAQRAIALATFVNTFGSGMFMTSSTLYFTQMVGLSTANYALGLFVGSMVGLVASLVIGRVADRVGARETQIAVMLSGAAGMSCFMFVSVFWQFMLVASLMGLVYAATTSSQAPLIRGFGGAQPAVYRAYLRSVTNLAMALGALGAGVAIEIGSRSAYLTMIGGRAAAFAGCALVLTRVPHLAPVRGAALTGRWQAMRDRPYLVATGLNACMSLHFAVPTVLLPLWIVEDTHAPRWMVSGVFVLNTVIVVCLQVRVSRGVEDHRSASRRMLWAGLAIAAGLTLTGAAAGVPAWVAVALLLAGTAVYTIGELWHAAASMEYSFGLAAPHLQGQYSGVFGIGTGVAQALAPSVVGVLPLRLGTPGLILLGLLFLGVGAVSRPLLSLALRHVDPAKGAVAP